MMDDDLWDYLWQVIYGSEVKTVSSFKSCLFFHHRQKLLRRGVGLIEATKRARKVADRVVSGRKTKIIK